MIVSVIYTIMVLKKVLMMGLCDTYDYSTEESVNDSLCDTYDNGTEESVNDSLCDTYDNGTEESVNDNLCDIIRLRY